MLFMAMCAAPVASLLLGRPSKPGQGFPPQAGKSVTEPLQPRSGAAVVARVGAGSAFKGGGGRSTIAVQASFRDGSTVGEAQRGASCLFRARRFAGLGGSALKPVLFTAAGASTTRRVGG